MKNNYIDVRTTFRPHVKTKNEFLALPERIQQMILEKLGESDVICTFIDNVYGVQVGDLVEVPFGKYGTNLGIVESVPNKMPLKDGIEYKQILTDRII